MGSTLAKLFNGTLVEVIMGHLLIGKSVVLKGEQSGLDLNFQNERQGVKMSDMNRFFHQLVESIQLLSADYSTQVDALPKFVVVPDEIALIYHDCILLLDQISEAGFLKAEDVRRLVEIDDKFNEMSREVDFWSLESLKRHSEWNNLRIVAKEILRSLGVPQAKPNLDWITFVGGNGSSSEN